MEKLFSAGLLLTVMAAFFWARPAWSRSDEDRVYSKRSDLPLLESASSSAKTVAKANWNEGLTVVKRDGRWLKVTGGEGGGWVYSGNVSQEKLPEENKNEMSIKASSMTSVAASRSLSDGADQYAGRHSLGEVATQVKWAEKLNSEISRDEAREYLKAHKLGEFSEAK